jgi:hypothetical protein
MKITLQAGIIPTLVLFATIILVAPPSNYARKSFAAARSQNEALSIGQMRATTGGIGFACNNYQCPGTIGNKTVQCNWAEQSGDYNVYTYVHPQICGWTVVDSTCSNSLSMVLCYTEQYYDNCVSGIGSTPVPPRPATPVYYQQNPDSPSVPVGTPTLSYLNAACS